MTFAEAAIEVLFRAGRPLHYKKITEAAIQEELLSHIGRTPEDTMGERLTQEAKKQADPAVEIVRPGVYKLSAPTLKRLEDEGRPKLPLGQKKKVEPNTSHGDDLSGNADDDQSDASSPDDSRRRKSRRSSRSESLDSKSRSSRSSRRRRRRSRKSDTPDETTDSRSSHNEPKSRSSRSRSRGRRSISNRRSSRSRSKNDRRSGRRDSQKSGRRDSEKPTRRNRRDDRRQHTKSQKSPVRRPANSTRHLKEGPVQIDAIARAARTVLSDNKRRPMLVKDLANEIFERKLVRFHTHDAAATIQAAMAGDNQIREKFGNRPLFIQYDRNRWGLTEWGLSDASVEREESILTLAEEIRQDAVDTLGKALTDIKPEAVEHLALTLLQRLNYRDIKVSKRSGDGDVFFTSDWSQGLADVRVCIQVVGDTDTDLDPSAVTDLRGTLHHYAASEGVIIHLGNIKDEAIDESREERLSPITLLDRDTFVELLIQHGIGVRTYQAPITMVDTSFIDALANA